MPQTTLVWPFICTYGPKAGSLPYLHAINQARLMVEARQPEAEWRSERALRSGQPFTAGQTGGEHQPDAEVLIGAQRVAIEVELNIKSKKRQPAILYALARRYPKVSAGWRSAWWTVQRCAIMGYWAGWLSVATLPAFRSREPPDEGALVGIGVFPAGEVANMTLAAEFCGTRLRGVQHAGVEAHWEENFTMLGLLFL